MKDFSEKQHKAIKLLATREIKGLSMEQVAELSGCSKMSLYRWLEDEFFKREVNSVALKEITNLSPQILGTTSKMLNSKDLKIQAKGLEAFSKITDKVEKAEVELKKQKEEAEKPSVYEILMELGVISRDWDKMNELQKVDWDIKVTEGKIKEYENTLKWLLDERYKLSR